MKKVVILSGISLILLLSCITKSSKVTKIELKESSVYQTNMFGESAAEIVDFYPRGKKVFFTNGKDGSLVILTNIDGNLLFEKKISFDDGEVNSIAIHSNLAAVAVASSTKTNNGKIHFINVDDGSDLGYVEVGALPDMVTFTPDGKYVLSANEGEPSEKYRADPEGSVSIIKVNYQKPSNSNVTNITFSESNFENSLDGTTVRTHNYLSKYISGYSATTDIEPEYIAVDEKSQYAYVTCQENNAIAKIDIKYGKVVTLKSLGYKDYSKCGVDIVEDGAVSIVSQPYYGLYMPDSITTFQVNGKTYIATANEGDDRADWEDGTDFEDNDVTKAKSLKKNFNQVLDSSLLDSEGNIKSELKSLKVSPYDSIDSDGDGDIDILVGFGARSFSIWDEDLNLVFDSGSLFETFTATENKNIFNCSNDNMNIDDRSPKKGPEPEAIAAGVVNKTPLLFVGLERFGGIFTFDVSDPRDPKMLGYRSNRNYTALVDKDNEYSDTSFNNTGDLGPEGFHFVSAQDSPSGYPELIIGNEVSGTVRIYDLELIY